MVSRKCLISFWRFLILINFHVSWANVIAGDNVRKGLKSASLQLENSKDGMSLNEKNCELFMDNKKQEFYSPNYPNFYTNNTDCIRVLEAPPSHLVKLDFLDVFHIEDSTDCKNDYLEIRDGRYGFNKVVNERRYCGTTFPPIIYSTGRYLWVRFKSDENIEYKGFRAVYQFIERPSNTPEIEECRFDLPEDNQGFISTTNIPVHLRDFAAKNNLPIDCLWVIVVRNNWKINLNFDKFLLEKANECESNIIEIFSVDTKLENRTKYFCGSIAESVSSYDNRMFVRFYAETKSTTDKASLFMATYTAFRDVKKEGGGMEQCDKEKEFDCGDDTCIAKELECNSVPNCRFRYDENEKCSTGNATSDMANMTIIIAVFSLILSGMCLAFIYNCMKKLIRDHQTIQEYIRQSREQQLNELDKQEQSFEAKRPPNEAMRSRSNSSSRSSGSHRFDAANAATVPCYVPGGELLPILVRNERSCSPSNGDIYTLENDTVGTQPEMCDSACQTRESLFTTQAYSSGHSTPSRTHTESPPAPFSTFGYNKKDSGKFRAEAKIEMAGQQRPYSVQTTKSAPDVIVTH